MGKKHDDEEVPEELWTLFTALFIIIAILAILGVKYAPWDEFGEMLSGHAHTETEAAAENEPQLIQHVEIAQPEYDPAIDEKGEKVPFGDGYFYLTGDSGSYIDNDGNFGFRRLADDYGHGDDLHFGDAGELTADLIPECGGHIAVHGSTSDEDPAYIECNVYAPYCGARIEFDDAPEDRTVILEDGSKISPLASQLIQYYFETAWDHPDRMKARFRRLEDLSKTAVGVEMRTYYDVDTKIVDWDDVSHIPIKRRGELFLLRETAKYRGFYAETLVEGGGVAFRRYGSSDRALDQDSVIRVYGAWNENEPAYFEAQLGKGVSIWMSFDMPESETEVVKLENGSKIPTIMARALVLAMDSLSYRQDWFEERFDGLDKTAPEGVHAKVRRRSVTKAEPSPETEYAEIAHRYGDGWVLTHANIAEWIKDGSFDLRTFAHEFEWRVDPATSGEMTIYPTKGEDYGYMVLSACSIRLYGNPEYAYILVSGPSYEIMVEFEGFDAAETVRLENGCVLPERAYWAALKAVEVMEEPQHDVYDAFKELKETCPNGVTISMNHFTRFAADNQ